MKTPDEGSGEAQLTEAYLDESCQQLSRQGLVDGESQSPFVTVVEVELLSQLGQDRTRVRDVAAVILERGITRDRLAAQL